MTGGDDRPDTPTPSPGRRRRNLHGRRRGRPLRRGLEALLDDLLPRRRVTLPTTGVPFKFEAFFGPSTRELWLEIGFGAGEHLAWQAARHTDVGFLGAEVFVNGIASLLRRVAEADLDNVRIYQGDARDLLDALPENSVARVFILFPDPWPKPRHHKRRIVRRAVLDRLADLMIDGAELRLATDHPDYLPWILERATSHPAFEWLARGPADWRHRSAVWPATRYELKAIEAGRTPCYLRFRRRPRKAA